MTVAARPRPSRTARLAPSRTRRAAAGLVAVLSAVLLLVTIASWIPGAIGTAAAAVLPWVGAGIAVAAIVALVRARRSLLLLAVPVLVWVLAIVPSAPGFATAGGADQPTIEVASQNVRAHSGGAAASAQALSETSADVIALIELDAESLGAAREVLDTDYPYSTFVGTVGVWSRFPLGDAEPLALGLGWKRALRVEVQTPDAPVALYAIHAASVRPGQQDDRDMMLAEMADAVAADPATAVILLGDFNASSADPALSRVRDRVDWVRPTDGTFGFTWPAAAPLARIDHVFSRGLGVLSSTTLRTGSSDHLATVTEFRL